jgi:hypothetical protein
MPESGEHRRRYGDKEVGLILKRAAELQRLEPESAAGGSGLTLAELEEIAAEAGIDPRHLRRATEDLDAGAASLHREGAAHLLGAPLSIKFERTLTGEIPESEFERLVPEIQQAADDYGQPSLLGRTLTWQSTSPHNERTLRTLRVVVSSQDGRTRIHIEERLGQLAGVLFGGVLGGGGGGIGLGIGLGVGIGALQSVLFAIAWPVGVIGGVYLLARNIYGSTVRRRQRVLRELLDRLTEHVESAISDERLEPGVRPPELPSA